MDRTLNKNRAAMLVIVTAIEGILLWYLNVSSRRNCKAPTDYRALCISTLYSPTKRVKFPHYVIKKPTRRNNHIIYNQIQRLFARACARVQPI